MSIGSARPMNSCMALRALARNVHHAALVLHEGDGAIRNQQREGDAVQVIGLQRTALQSLDPGLRNLFAQFEIFNPLDLRPQPLHSLPHAQSPQNVPIRLACGRGQNDDQDHKGL